MSSRYSLARDLDELERMTERLRDYVLGDALYMSIGGGFARGASMPQLTIGNLLLRRRRLCQLRTKLDSAQDARLSKALARHKAIQREWRLHYENKLKQEVPARLRLLRAFLFDCGEHPRNCAGAYPVEAMRRTVVEEILLAMAESNSDTRELKSQVETADATLRRLLDASDFIWSAVLTPVYARETFWWLYGGPAN